MTGDCSEAMETVGRMLETPVRTAVLAGESAGGTASRAAICRPRPGRATDDDRTGLSAKGVNFERSSQSATAGTGRRMTAMRVRSCLVASVSTHCQWAGGRRN